MYEGYRLEEEPDSPGIPFAELSEDEKDKVIGSFQSFQRSVLLDGVLLGFVTVVRPSADNEVNVGMYLFPEHRGKGLASAILRALVVRVREDHPGSSIVASTRTENRAMLKALLSAGFETAQVEVRPRLGKWDQDISYQKFIFPVRR